MRQQSIIHSQIAPQQFEILRKTLRGMKITSKEMGQIKKLGIGLDMSLAKNMAREYQEFKNRFIVAEDAIQATVTTASIGTPIQFLQNWLPGFVFVQTAARKIDNLTGIMITGAWSDEEIVQGILERTGYTVPYSDYGNVPLSSWNVNFVTRTVVRFEEGMQVGILEAQRASRMNVDSAGMKRESAALALDIIRNTVGFLGFNSGLNNTYGFLNDPGEPSYGTVPPGASTSPLWSTKTFLEICKDIRTAVVALRTNSQDTIDPEMLDLTLAIATNSVDWLSTTSDFGISVREWLKKAYPRMRVVSAPQLNSANGGANVFYLFADKIEDMSSDDSRTFVQAVPAKFQVLGVQQLPKGYIEDYSNATAGMMCKRPWSMVRYSGI